MNKQFTSSQLESAFDEITNSALVVKDFCTQAIALQSYENEAAARLIVATRAMVERIGWIASRHCNACSDDPAEWMLPPSCAQASKEAVDGEH